MTELSRRLHGVDPELKIISPHGHHHRRRQHDNWEKSRGVTCSKCGQEVFRQRNGLCFPCWEQANEIELRMPDWANESHELSEFDEITVKRKNSS